MYKVIKGKEGSNVNGIILGKATQEELEHFYKLGLPFIQKDIAKPKKAKKADGK